MILTCPDCATRYFVEADRLGPQGRTVRCAACGASWRAEPEAEPPLDLVPPPPLPPEPKTRPGDLDIEAVAPKAIPKLFRAISAQKRRTRRAVAAGVVWAALGACFIAVVLAAVLFRVDVVRLWPRTAGAYAFVRMPVNPTGLAIEAVHGAPGLQNGQAAVVVTGSLRNIEAAPRPAPALRVALIDKAARPLAVRRLEFGSLRIAPGDQHAFQAVFLDPPAEATDVRVEFAFDPPPPARPLAAAKPRLEAARLGLRGPAAPPPLAPVKAVEAQPLPAASPYALPAAGAAKPARG